MATPRGTVAIPASTVIVTENGDLLFTVDDGKPVTGFARGEWLTFYVVTDKEE